MQRQAANIYTMMLILSFLAISLGCLFLFMEMRAYDMSVKVPPAAKAPPPNFSLHLPAAADRVLIG